jgi:hypothetical protein
MIKQLLDDSQIRPDLFQFMGPLAEVKLDAWLKDRHYSVPNDLRELWRDTGGGTLFETETILAPLEANELGDDVESINSFHHKRGMPAIYLIFHIGIGGLSAIAMDGARYVSISEDTYAERGNYTSIDDWYLRLIRAEYATRYGLDEGQ